MNLDHNFLNAKRGNMQDQMMTVLEQLGLNPIKMEPKDIENPIGEADFRHQLKNTSAEYWILESIKSDKLTYDNPLTYQGYRICHSDGLHPSPFVYIHEDYDGAPDAKDHRHGYCKSIEDCIHEINQYIIENKVEIIC